MDFIVSGRLKLYLTSEGVSYALFYQLLLFKNIMRAVIQKVTQAKVDVLSENSCETCGEINNGFMILLGVTHTDTEADAKYIADKTANLRIFEDENGKFICDMVDGGQVKTNLKMQTSLKGLFVAGDIREDAPKQVIVAAGDGAVAALSAMSYIESLH